MRAFRSLTIAALLSLNVGYAGAQASRGFKDSWFWGVKSGLLSYQVVDNGVAKNPFALLGGGDWLITRSSGGLYFSFDHTFFKADSLFVNDSLTPLDTVPRVVSLKGLRRFTLAGLLFPFQTYRLHPYFGIGVTLSSIVEANPHGTYRNSVQQNLVLATIEAFRSNASPMVMFGAQLRLPIASLFGQVTATPANNNFFLFSGNNWRTSAEAGLRFNAGSSIDRIR